MPVVAIIGAQWGDEGKGKVVDLLAERADLVVRYAGGNNAGHTVINPLGEFAMHLIPCGIFHAHPRCVIGNGVVVDPRVLLDEIKKVTAAGVDVTGRLVLSDRSHIIMPYHIQIDELEEQAKGSNALGTTRRGVGPAYADKAARIGIRAGDLLDGELLWERLRGALDQKNRVLNRLYGAASYDLQALYDEHREYGRLLAPYIVNTEELLNSALDDGKLVLLEGAQGTMLDIDFGTYPFVTSSSPGVGGAPQGSGIAPTRINTVMGVYKAYTTRVGSGAMPTELNDEVGERIRTIAHEFGTTTGRPRRCGWFDGVAARLSSRINHFSAAAVARLDVLDSFESIKVCTAYRVEGAIIDRFPSNLRTLEQCEPIYEELPGWMAPTENIRNYGDLPRAAQQYIERLEQIIGCPVDLISVGPSREQTVSRRPIF